jgi:DNA-binding Lrp family transcriptional regulator
MEEERIEMSQKERDWLHWLKQVQERKITQQQAAQRMGITERWVRKLLKKLKRRGDRAVVHGLRGRSSNHRIGEAVREKAVGLIQAEYRDFGPTLAAEYLAEGHGIVASKETVRQWMMGAKLWKAKPARVEEVHVWRARRGSFGELVQWDSSEHDWLEGRGEKLYLMGMIDDATSRAWARFARHDSTEENMRLLRGYLERWGRPLDFYTDKAGLFHVNPGRHYNKHVEEEKRVLTQIGRALEELGIGWIGAHSPQAKGRIERFFGTAQDRLVKGLRKAGARTMDEANRYLEGVYLPLWNRRFTEEPAEAVDAHRPLLKAHDLAGILSRVEPRVVTNDYTLRWGGQIYQIERADVGPALRGARVRVEQRLDGSLAVRWRDRYLRVSVCPVPRLSSAPAIAAPKPPRRTYQRGSDWLRNFDLKDSPPLWKILREEAPQPGRESW